MVADAAGPAKEQHRRGHASRQDHRVVAGAADDRCAGTPCCRNCVLQSDRKAGSIGIADCSRCVATHAKARGGAIFRAASKGLDRRPRERRPTRGGCPAVISIRRQSRCLHPASFDPSDRGHQARRRVRLAFDDTDPFGGAGHGVAPHGHWRRTRMIGCTGERHDETGLAGDGTRRSPRGCRGLEHRPLFDVQFEIAKRLDRRRVAWNDARVEAELADNVGDRTAVRIDARRRNSSSTVPIKARLPMNGTPNRTPSSSENPAISIANGSGRCRKDLDDRDPQHHAEHAVEGAGVRRPCRDASR